MLHNIPRKVVHLLTVTRVYLVSEILAGLLTLASFAALDLLCLALGIQ